jgi:hypothetical protein
VIEERRLIDIAIFRNRAPEFALADVAMFERVAGGLSGIVT